MNARLLRFWLLGCATAFGAVVALAQEPPPVVLVSKPLVREVEDFLIFNGHAEPEQTVDLRARVGGMLAHVTFPNGAMVRKGDVLFELDPQQYKLEALKAEAEVARSESRVKRASADLDRAKKMVAAGTLTAEEYRRTEADLADAMAGARSAAASLELARLHLSHTKITAPIDGRVSRALLTPGNLVNAYTTPLATLVATEAMVVAFDVDQETVLRLQKLRREGGPKETAFKVFAEEPDRGFTLAGKLAAVDFGLNPEKGTQQWRAEFPNKNQRLLPGLAMKVQVKLPTAKMLLIGPGLFTKAKGTVSIVNDKSIIEVRSLVLGELFDGMYIVRQGLKESDRIAHKSSVQRAYADMIVKAKQLEKVEVYPVAGLIGMKVTPKEVAMPRLQDGEIEKPLFKGPKKTEPPLKGGPAGKANTKKKGDTDGD